MTDSQIIPAETAGWCVIGSWRDPGTGAGFLGRVECGGSSTSLPSREF